MKHLKRFNETNSDDLLEIQIYLEEIGKHLRTKGLNTLNIISESPLVFEYATDTISKKGYSEKVSIDDNLLFTWLDVKPGVYTTAYYAPEQLQFNSVQEALDFLNGRYRKPQIGCYWDISNWKRDRSPKRYYKPDKGDSWTDTVPKSWR